MAISLSIQNTTVSFEVQSNVTSLLTIMAVAGHFVRGFLYNEVLFGTAKAGYYMCYRGNRLMQTISVRTDWESGTLVMWPLCCSFLSFILIMQ